MERLMKSCRSPKAFKKVVCLSSPVMLPIKISAVRINSIVQAKLIGQRPRNWLLPMHPSFQKTLLLICTSAKLVGKQEKNARMFAQVNHVELMKEFLEVVLSPLQLTGQAPQLQSPKERGASQEARNFRKKIRVFVSYAHQDRKYLANDSLPGYLKGLEQEGFEFWHDQNILAGELWSEEIQKQMASADIALVLVSQAFLHSQYCQEREAASFITERKKRGLIIVPIILSACSWEGYDWLRSTQFLQGIC